MQLDLLLCAIRQAMAATTEVSISRLQAVMHHIGKCHSSLDNERPSAPLDDRRVSVLMGSVRHSLGYVDPTEAKVIVDILMYAQIRGNSQVRPHM